MVKSLEKLQKEFQKVNPKSFNEWERNKKTLPGGVIKGAYFSSPYPIYISKAEGCKLFDIDDKEYTDFSNHHTAMILGHSHPAVIKAVQEAVNNGLALSAPSILEGKIAHEFIERFPSIEQIRYTNSGTESSITAARMVRAITGKSKIAKFAGNYHGFNDSLEFNLAVSPNSTSNSEFIEPVPAWSGMPQYGEKNIIILPMNDPETVEMIVRENKNELAAIFFDGKPGILDIPIEFTKFLRKLTSELGILFVMDEVISFRSSRTGYQGIADVIPDISIFGKIVGGGMPVGAIGGATKFMNILDNSGPSTGLSQSGTFAGNHVTLAAGLATMQNLTPQVYTHLDQLREKLHNGIVDIFKNYNIPCKVVSKGSIVNTYLTDKPITNFEAASASDKDLWERIMLSLLLKGIYARDGMGFVLSEPMGVKDIDNLLENLTYVINEN
ncbi:MAG: aminotransferase class III-fold pyridoxal phosphate-dependent enzyme [SAR202 cluster bacterium]|nr:aminotransferase class III-fold pyridoxal phosphate-dependent enzyme [SAR202 cluster bacterium]|tara:strand:- start:167 stop:1489 length:1323 start_codon:yes stop_codon:yes gene_type:complete